MQLLFRVDQKAALLRGIDAPTSTVRLDVDPAQLTEGERALLASAIEDGHDCTREPAAVADGHRLFIVLVEPSVAGLRAALAEIAQKVAEAEAKEKERQEKEKERRERAQAERNEEARQALAAFARGERRREYDSRLPLPLDTYALSSVRPAPEILAEIVKANEVIERERAELLEQIARERAEKERAEKERAELLSLLTEEQRKREAAGVLPLREKEAAVRKTIPVPEGAVPYKVPEDCTHQKTDLLKSMTAEQFAMLESIRDLVQKATEDGVSGLTVEDPKDVDYWRKATEDDDADDVDSDGEVWAGKAAFVVVKRTLAGVTAQRVLRLGD